MLVAFGAMVPVVAGGGVAHAAGPDLAITVTTSEPPGTAGTMTRLSVVVRNLGDAPSTAGVVTATATGGAVHFFAFNSGSWPCYGGPPLSGECVHDAIPAGGSTVPLAVDALVTGGPATLVVTVRSGGDCCADNNSTTIVLKPRGMEVNGTVWSDDNGNGRRDPGEALLHGVELIAYIAGTSIGVQTTRTARGKYSFVLPDDAAPNLDIILDPHGEQGRATTWPNVGPDDLDSDFPADRKITLAFIPGPTANFDAGLLPPGVSPSPVVWPTASTTPDGGGGQLPRTGFSLPWLLGLGGLLAATGALLLLMLRNRRPVA